MVHLGKAASHVNANRVPAAPLPAQTFANPPGKAEVPQILGPLPPRWETWAKLPTSVLTWSWLLQTFQEHTGRKKKSSSLPLCDSAFQMIK